MGWTGDFEQWRHYTRGFLFFAALATPLVISVHSVVSWDFALALTPGWHTTIFPPYFVVGAIFSGFAMVMTLMVITRVVFKASNPKQAGALPRILGVIRIIAATINDDRDTEETASSAQ